MTILGALMIACIFGGWIACVIAVFRHPGDA